MTLVCGVDGCRNGWVAVFYDLHNRECAWRVCSSLTELADTAPRLSIIAIDVPIGLPVVGARACDLEARRLLGKRGSSVFPAPIRAVLGATTHAEASGLRREAEGKGMSIQAWAIVPKIIQVDQALRAHESLRRQVREVHPEICFHFMAGGRSMEFPKKKLSGKDERIRLLDGVFPGVVERALADRRALACATDDLLDAFAGAWTASRIAEGKAVRLPERPEWDSEGLPMEMIA
jgi:predicted RNase H-like nuclease